MSILKQEMIWLSMAFCPEMSAIDWLNHVVMNIAYNNVLRILNQFAVSPLNKARMMSLNKNQQNSDTQAYIDSILNG